MKKKYYIKPRTFFVDLGIGDILDVIEPGSGQDFSNENKIEIEEDPISDGTSKSLWDDV